LKKADNNNQSLEEQGKLRRIVLSVLTIVLVIALSVLLFLFRDKVAGLESLGYLGAFLISLVANATIFLPMPGLLVLIGLGAVFNPILIGLIGAAGGAIGELTGYTAGLGGRGLTKGNRMYVWAEDWMKKRGFLTIFLFSLLPILPLDVAGGVGGILRYPLLKFLLACFLGKAILYLIWIHAGAWGLESLLRFSG